MSLMSGVPVPPALMARYSRTREGRAWLDSLPDLLAGRLGHWDLAVDLRPGQLPWHGHGALVLPVRRHDGTRAALKIAFPHDEARGEAIALQLWDGRGAVQLLDSDADSCSLLLERLDGGRSLQSEPLHVAMPVWGGLMRQLEVVPDDRPQWRELDHIAARAEQWSDDMPADWERLGRPFPRWLLEAALEVCQTRGAVGRRSWRDVLVHTDLHFLNILARPNGSGYAAIDPQPLIGEAEFAVAPMLWNRLGDLSRSDPGAGLRERCRELSAAAGLDPAAARQWSVAREVDNALHYAADRQHEGDMLRSLWVASTLAGRTLDGLPAAHSLPEPGAGLALS